MSEEAPSRKSTPTYHEPMQNDDASFMSSHIPEKFTPELDQLRRPSVQNAWVLFANQSGNTCMVGHLGQGPSRRT